jgi:SNF2 family DNA or RNA helicase
MAESNLNMGYVPNLKLYAHQQTALRTMAPHKAFGLFMAMRTGKSAVIVTEFGEKLFSGEATDLLIVAPAGAYRTWETELKKHMPPAVYAALKIYVWQSGKKAPQITTGGARVLLVNVEALSTVEACEQLCREFLRSGKTIMVIDESTTIKNPRSQRTIAACALGPLAQYRRILSGLPTPRSPLDLFSQCWFLDPDILGFKKYYTFSHYYANWRKINVGARKIEIVAGYKNIAELKAKLSGYSFRVRLEDCYDVPPKLYLTREVELTPEQTRMYKELKKYATTQLASGEHVTTTEVITQMLRLHQLCCGHLTDEEDVLHEVKSNRPAELLRLLAEYDGKAVIWCSYRQDIETVTAKLRKEYGDEAVAVFYGGNVKDREAESARFETQEDCRFMIATPGSGGRGRTWSMAGLIVYYSNTDNLEHRDQSEERASGVGKSERVTVVDFITKGTVEEKIVHALRNKIDLAATITGDDFRQWVV